MPMQRNLYPSNWEQIALDVKDAAGWHCQQCRRPCRRPGQSFLEFALPYVESGQMEIDDLNHPQRYTLTVAHLNHRPEDCSPQNLRALCAPCHCKYDTTSQARAIKKQLKLERNGQLKL